MVAMSCRWKTWSKYSRGSNAYVFMHCIVTWTIDAIRSCMLSTSVAHRNLQVSGSYIRAVGDMSAELGYNDPSCHCQHTTFYQHSCCLNDFDFSQSAAPFFGWLQNYNIIEIQLKQQLNVTAFISSWSSVMKIQSPNWSFSLDFM